MNEEERKKSDLLWEKTFKAKWEGKKTPAIVNVNGEWKLWGEEVRRRNTEKNHGRKMK